MKLKGGGVLFFDEFNPETVVMEVEQGGQIQRHTLSAPKMLLMQNFASNVQSAAGNSEPIALKMSRWVDIYDNFDQKWIKREVFVRFTNNAYENRSSQNENN